MSTRPSGKAKSHRRRRRGPPPEGAHWPPLETRPFDHAYLNGVFLALNAIPDTRMLFDGPSCGYDRTFLVHGTHDLFSTLVGNRAESRVWCSQADPNAVIHDRSGFLLEMLRRMHTDRRTSLVMLVSMMMASVTGIDYDAIIREVRGDPGLPVVRIPEGYDEGDWLDGYDEAMLQISRSMDLRPARQRRKDVGIVGYMFDRNEGDHRGNVAEIRRLCRQLSVNPVSIWLDGSPIGDLASIQMAGTVISLPYGRRTAAEIAQRCGSRLVELDLPFGLRGSREWVEALGRISRKRSAAADVVSDELSDAIPVIDQVMNDHLLGRRFAVYGDTYLAEAVTSALMEVGCHADHAVICGREQSRQNLRRTTGLTGIRALHDPMYHEVLDVDGRAVDIWIGHSLGHYMVRARGVDRPYLELGYPSYRHHCLTAQPFFLFRGFVGFVNRIVNGG